jgi:hypothetical protein
LQVVCFSTDMEEIAMIELTSILKGAGMGAGLMYFFDPDLGRRRRSLVRDQLVHGTCQTRKAADVFRRDAGNRLHGMAAEFRGALRRDEPAAEVLEARVRSRIGRMVSHPAAIAVAAHDGEVILSGPVLADEVQSLLTGVRHVRGVERVVNSLDVHRVPGNVSALQGGSRREYRPLDLMQDNWSPTTRVALGLTGLGLMAAGVGRGSAINRLLGAFGLGLTASVLLRGQGAVGRAGGAATSDSGRHLPRPKIEALSSHTQVAEPAVFDL